MRRSSPRIRGAALALMLLPTAALALAQEAAPPPPPSSGPPATDAPAPDGPATDALPDGARARLGTTRFRHPDSVLSLAFTPDGKAIASGGAGGNIWIWEFPTGRLLRKHWIGEPVNAVAFSPDGSRLAGGFGDPFSFDRLEVQARLWDARTGRRLRDLFRVRSPVLGLAFSPDGTALYATEGAAPDAQGNLLHWDVATGRLIRLRPIGRGSPGLSISPDGKRLAIAPWDSGPKILVDESLADLHDLALPRSDASYGSAWSPDGSLLATAHYRKSIRLWRTDTGELVRELAGHASSVWSVAFSPDGKTLASNGDDLAVRIWDVETGEVERSFERPGGGSRWARHTRHPVAISPDGKWVAASGEDSAISIRSIDTGRSLSGHEGHTGPVWSVRFSPDGRTLATASGDRTLRIWDAATGEERRRLEGHDFAVRTIAFSPDGKSLASGSIDDRVGIWDVSTGESLSLAPLSDDRSPRNSEVQPTRRVDPGAPHFPTALVFEKGGSSLIVASGERGVDRIGVPGGERRELHGTATEMGGPADDPMQARARLVIRFDRSGSPSPRGEIRSSAALSPDARHLYVITRRIERPDDDEAPTRVGGPAVLRLDLGDDPGEPLVILPDAGTATCLALSPGGRVLAVGTANGTAQIYEMDTGRRVIGWMAHWADMEEGGIGALAFGPDGRHLATASPGENVVRVWDWTTGHNVQSYHGHAAPVLSLDFSPDGATLASGARDSTVLLWRFDPTRFDEGDGDETEEELSPGDLVRLWNDPAWDEDLDAEALEEIWRILGSDEAGEAYRAVATLAAHPEATAAFLRERLWPRDVPTPDEIRLRIARLGHDDFETREQAQTELIQLGEAVTDVLRAVLDEEANPEILLRGREILEGLSPPYSRFPCEPARRLRALLALEWMGTADSVEMMRALATGSPMRRERAEAARVLGRWGIELAPPVAPEPPGDPVPPDGPEEP